MREQVPHGRAGRPCWLVEVEDALLRGHQRGKRRHQLRDRGPAENDVRRAALGDDAFAGDDRDGRGRRRPRVDLFECFHGRRY